MNLSSTDFELFDVPARFGQDLAVLEARWKALQSMAHPDRHASAGAAAQRVSMQWSVRINEAYQRLKDPLKRAAYLCALNGNAVDPHNNQAMAPAFLIQQMSWREALEDAPDAAAVDALAQQVAGYERQLMAELADLIDVQANWPAAARQVQALMFVVRFAQDIDRRLDALGQ